MTDIDVMDYFLNVGALDLAPTYSEVAVGVVQSLAGSFYPVLSVAW